MNKDLKIIKKKYGEEMMHFCRNEFSSILETEGKLSSLLLANFEPNHELYNDLEGEELIEEFINFINSLVDYNKICIKTEKTPEELLDEAGYILYECKCEADIQRFKKYYAFDEKLCTFSGGRLDDCHVFFAVKKNVDEIKRENFKHPERQDEYGTSVISIQFTKDGTNTLSIKNRYNHTVKNPDATYSNNLDNIIPGLTYSFEKHYGMNQKYHQGDLELTGYVLAKDGRYYKYNYEIENVYYCPNNIIIDNFEVNRLEKEKYIVIDYFIVNLQKKVINYNVLYEDDAFVDTIPDLCNIKIEKNKDSKIIYLTPQSGEVIEIEIDKNNKIIGYKNNNIVEIGKDFLYYNEDLRKIECSNVLRIGDCFLINNEWLEEISLPKVEEIGDYFIRYNRDLKLINCENLQIIGNNFMDYNNSITKINFPNVIKIGNSFLNSNRNVVELNIPEVQEIGYYFMNLNRALEEVKLLNLKKVGDNFLEENRILKTIEFPELEEIGYNFLMNNQLLKEVYLPKVKSVEFNFLKYNDTIKKIDCPLLETIDNAFLYGNNSLEEINLPNVKSINNEFLRYNQSLKTINLPNVQTIGDGFMQYNDSLQEFYASNLYEIGNYSLAHNTCLSYIDLRSLEKYGYNFLIYNSAMQAMIKKTRKLK